MALRFLLVSLVAGLGIDPPSLPEITSWANAGRVWVQARLDDLTGARVVSDLEPTDQEFDGVVAVMANEFAVDLAAMNRPRPTAPVEFEPIIVADQLDTGLAFQLNRDSDGEAQPQSVAGSLLAVAGSPAESTHGPVVIATSDEPGRTSRLASAVRLTQQAALAWMTLLHDTDPTGICK